MSLHMASSQPALVNPLSAMDGQYTHAFLFPFAFQGSRGLCGLSGAIHPSHDHAKTLSLSSSGGACMRSGFSHLHPASEVHSMGVTHRRLSNVEDVCADMLSGGMH
jgi:hypothetical protein